MSMETAIHIFVEIVAVTVILVLMLVYIKKLNVKCGIHGKKIDFSKFEQQNLTDKNLNRTLPMLALETAEEINNIKYEL